MSLDKENDLGAKRVNDLIKAHRKTQEDICKDWDKWESWYRAEYWQTPELSATNRAYQPDITSSTTLNIASNYPFPFIDTMIANVCPTNPQVTVQAKKADEVETAKNHQTLINNFLRGNQTTQKLWRLASFAAVTGRGVVKVVWDEKKKTPKLIVVPSKRFFFDIAANDWEDISYCGEFTPITQADFDERVKKGIYDRAAAEGVSGGGYPNWLLDAHKSSKEDLVKPIDHFKWVLVCEFYDFVNGKLYHFVEGKETPVFTGDLPFRYVANPYKLLVFNDNLKDIGGLSDIKLIETLQERLNEIDTLELVHAFASIPVLLIDSGRCQNIEEVEAALRGALSPGTVARINTNANVPGSIRDLFGSTPVPQLSPSFSTMRNRIVNAIEFTLGIPQYSRGIVGNAEVATEAALADGSLRTRNGRRIKAIEDVVSWIARAVVCLYQEFMSVEDEVYVRDEQKPGGSLDRSSLGFGLPPNQPEEVEALLGPSTTLPNIDELLYWYDMAPYSPAENTRLVQLATLQAQWPTLWGNPNVDQKKLVLKLVQLLVMEDLFIDTPEMPMSQEAPPAPAGLTPEGVPPMTPEQLLSLGATGVPNAAGGDLPPGTEPPPIPGPGGGPGSPLSPRVAGALGGKTGIAGTGT